MCGGPRSMFIFTQSQFHHFYASLFDAVLLINQQQSTQLNLHTHKKVHNERLSINYNEFTVRITS